jgi:hypothetical protein
MTIDININEITLPVIKETERSSFIKRFVVSKIEGYFEKKVAKSITAVEDTILKIEGSHFHLKKFSVESAKRILPSIKKAIETLENRFDVLEKINFFENKELKVKYKYLLKSIYKSEAIIHKIAFSNEKTLSTDKSIKNGIIKMNSTFIKKSV